MKPTMKNKQRGAAIMDNLIASSFIALAIIFVISQAPKLMYQWNKIQFQTQAADIVAATQSWKKLRPNYDGVTITKVCQDGQLSKNVCGSSNDGVATNPFGGNWTVVVDTASKGLFKITGTLPSDADRVSSLADTMAPTTRSACIEASGCSTLSTTANSITMTY